MNMKIFKKISILILILLLAEIVNGFKKEIIEALMIESLRSNRVQACDNEKITLHCPRNTHILIQNAFYGRVVPSAELCPNSIISTTTTTTTTNLHPNINSTNEFSSTKNNYYHQKLRRIHHQYEDTSCDVTDAHMKIVEICRNKRKCRIDVNSNFFGDNDPCPTTTKYLQMSYKCKPISFEDQNFCEGTTMQLNCKQNKRLSIYSAQYGRTINGQAMHCSLREPVNEDCVSDVLPLILKKCHAKTECTIGVNDHFLGTACANGIQKYLSLIYMCVNEEVFSEAALKGQMDSMKELEEELLKKEIALAKEKAKKFKKNEIFKNPTTIFSNSLKKEINLKSSTNSYYGVDESFENYSDVDDVDDDDSEYPSVMEKRHNLEKFPTTKSTIQNNQKTQNVIGIKNDDFFDLFNYFKENQERSLLYLILFIAGCIIFVLLFCIFYQCLTKTRSKKTKIQLLKNQKASEQLYNNCNMGSSGNSQSSKIYYPHQQTISLTRPSTTTKLTTARSIGSNEINSLIGVNSRCNSNQTSPLCHEDSEECNLKNFGALVPAGDYCSSGSGTSFHNSIQNGCYSGGSCGGGGGNGSMTFGSGHYMRFSHIPTPPRIPSSLHYYS